MSEEKKATESAEEVKATQTEAAAETKKAEAKTEKAESPAEETKSKKESTKKTAEKPESPAEKEFNWDDFETKAFGEGYSDKEKQELETLYENTLNTIEEKKVIHGTIVSIGERDVVLNIGYKSDGLVSSSEFRDTPDLKVGDQIEVYIEEQENAQGQLVLSRRKAKIVRAWELIQEAYEAIRKEMSQTNA